MVRKTYSKGDKKPFAAFRRAFFILRLISLICLVGFTYQLVRWSHDYDPRFYQFLSTAPGKALSGFMDWPNLYNRVQKEKNFAEFSQEDKNWHEKILTRIQQSWPTHTLTFKDGKKKDVRILSTGDGKVMVREYLGSQGRLETRISTSELSGIEPYTEALPHVSQRDILFQKNFPDFELSYSGHYTILTDAPYYQVADSVKTLEELHSQYVRLFAPLIRFPQKEQSLQVLFFTNEKDYREHQNETAPQLNNSVGYYSPLEDRMVVFNQQFSDRANKVRAGVGEDIADLLRHARNASDRKHILQLQQRAEAEIRDRAQRETLATLRHEGAHHLSYTYGVHSWIHTENGWLIEGLASYFEVPTPGQVDPLHLETLLVLDLQNRIPGLARLVEIRQPEEFEAELTGLKAHEAYALSWSLFHFCMLPENRDAFFDYLRALQSPGNIGKLMDTPRTGMLAEALGLDTPGLERAWRAHIQKMLGAG